MNKKYLYWVLVCSLFSIQHIKAEMATTIPDLQNKHSVTQSKDMADERIKHSTDKIQIHALPTTLRVNTLPRSFYRYCGK